MTRLNLSSHLGQDEAYYHPHLSFHLVKEMYQVIENYLFILFVANFFASKNWDYASNSLRLRSGSIAAASNHKRAL